MNAETYGNGLIHAVDYNNRLQATQIKLGTSGNPTSVVSLGYGYGTTDNNGNVRTHAYSGGGLSYTQTFDYDALNRLTTATESASSWSQTNGYDRYGNRWIDLGGGNRSLYINTSNNRITGGSYDAAGNLLNDGSHTYTYDAENKIAKVDNTSAYVYDGEGQRVRKLVGDNLRFVYGIGGQLIAEFSGSGGSLQKEYIYGASGLLATIDPTAVNSNGTRYTTPDHLGSPRVVTNSAASVISRHDYMPFGEEIGAGIGGRITGIGFSGASDGIRQKFTSKERDVETGLDYFRARYYASTQGRFTGVDPISIGVDRLFDPQRFNRYAYVRNNPLMFTDPDGRDIVLGSGDQKRAKQALVEIAKRPGGRELLTKMDKLTLTIMITSGEVGRGRDAYGSTKGSYVVTKDGLDAKNGPSGNGVVITLDFKKADADRKENKERTENNKGMEAAGLPGKPLIPDVPKSDAQLEGHEITHLEFDIFKNGNTRDEDAVTGRIDSILGQPVDKSLAKDAEKFVDNLVQPNQPQQQAQPTPEPKKEPEDE